MAVVEPNRTVIYNMIVSYSLWLSCSETKIGGLASYNAHFERCASWSRNTTNSIVSLSQFLFFLLFKVSIVVSNSIYLFILKETFFNRNQHQNVTNFNCSSNEYSLDILTNRFSFNIQWGSFWVDFEHFSRVCCCIR